MNIAAKIADITENVEKPDKSGEHKYDGFEYHTRDDLVDVLRAPLSKAGIATSMDVELIDHRKAPPTSSGTPQFRSIVKVTLTFTDSESGESLSTSACGESVMKQDKATASAITQAVRYALINTFNFSDGMIEEMHGGKPGRKNVNRSSNDGTPPFKAIKARMKDMEFSPDQYKAFMQKLAAKEGVEGPEDISDARRAVWKKRICGGPEDKVRKKIMGLIDSQDDHAA